MTTVSDAKWSNDESEIQAQIDDLMVKRNAIAGAIDRLRERLQLLQIERLRSEKDWLPDRDREFAHSLLAYFDKNDYLTPKQAEWLSRLLSKSKSLGPKPTEDLAEHYGIPLVS